MCKAIFHAMRLFAGRTKPALVRAAVLVAVAGVCTASDALVRMEIDTLTLLGAKTVVRASSCLQGPRVFSLANLFDNDSTTCWIEGYTDTVTGRWFDLAFAEPKRFRGVIFGLGCRQDFTDLADFGAPAAVRVKFDEKDAIDRSAAWEWGAGSLAYADINMRKAILWFNADTAFTTSRIRVKFTSAMGGCRYGNLAVSDFEPIDEFDNRFQLLSLLVSRSFDPNDLGVVNSSVIPGTPAEPQWVAHVADSVVSAGIPADPSRIQAQINAAFGATPFSITGSDGIAAYMAAFKALLVTGPMMPRFVFDGPKTIYLLPVGSMRRGNLRIDIWRRISSERTSRGLEVTVDYVSFVN